MSSGESNYVASRVFGRSVFNDLNTSLSYTPSPGASKKNASLVSILEEGESAASESTPAPTVLFKPDSSIDRIGSEKRVSFAQDGKENMNSFESRKSLNSIRSAELSRLRASTKETPSRRNLVKMTEAAIDDATTSLKKSALKKKQNSAVSSVYQSVNVGRSARSKNSNEKAKAVKSVSFQWDQENAKAKSLHKMVEENRRQIRAIQRKLTTDHFKDKARKDEAQKLERLAELEKEYMFKSKVHQDHQKALKLEKDKKRKMSIDARAKIRRNNREGEETLRAKKLEEDQAIFEVRADLHRSRMEAKEANAEKRRMSYQFRAGDARRIRDVRSDWKANDFNEKHISHDLDRAAAKDVDNYKKQMKKESRDDLKKRNKDANEARRRQEDRANEAMMEEQRSYELKWEGERDAEAYRERMKEERRKSLAGRNKESARHAKVMEELRSIAIENEAQSFMLKFSAENDAKEYVAKLAEERRKSLQLRGIEARKRRQLEEEEHSKAIESALIEGALQSDCKFEIMIPRREYFFRSFLSLNKFLCILFQCSQARKMSKTTKPTARRDDGSPYNTEESRLGCSDSKKKNDVLSKCKRTKNLLILILWHKRT
jgi:hypothetical protein